MPVTLNPNASTRLQTGTLRFGNGATVKECFPSRLLPVVPFVDHFQKRVIHFQAGDEPELDFLVNHWETYDKHMGLLQDSIKNKEVYDQKIKEKLALLEERGHRVSQKYADVAGIVFDGVHEDSVQLRATAPATPAASVEPGEEGKGEEGAEERAKDDKDFKKQAAANWTPRNKRTRFKVLTDLGKQYVTRGPLLGDSLWSLGIGAVLAIGSPVMAVTIPTTFAFFLAGRAALALIHTCQDPRGESINEKYQKWIEKDAEKLKKQEST
ncbi:hypothetical protein [Vampirovibrio chlorellavorus]|uniref:hypothetical protein n=1 Tax=Vampirovibrio chlorellavorus TaxID=758823 RepID=UPI0026F16A08|nr:hypothetical protein [Vampirovibrio chlorellavorus]